FPTAGITLAGTLPTGVTFLDNGDGTATLSYNGTSIVAGTYNLTFTASNTILPDATQNFTLTVNAGAAANIAIQAGNNQSAIVNTSFATSLQVKVTDQFGNAVSGAAVTFTPPASGPSGSFVSSATVTSNSLGVATAPTLVANGLLGTFSLKATAA